MPRLLQCVNRLVRVAFHLLDLQCFFTAGPKEVRAWTIKKGMTAPQAAGVIHSDFERGFIAAQIVSFDDLMACGTEGSGRMSEPATILEAINKALA